MPWNALLHPLMAECNYTHTNQNKNKSAYEYEYQCRRIFEFNLLARICVHRSMRTYRMHTQRAQTFAAHCKWSRAGLLMVCHKFAQRKTVFTVLLHCQHDCSGTPQRLRPNDTSPNTTTNVALFYECVIIVFELRPLWPLWHCQIKVRGNQKCATLPEDDPPELVCVCGWRKVYHAANVLTR